MEYSKDILNKIVGLGSLGYSIARIATELNTTADKLKDLRLNDSKLDDALTRARYNENEYVLSEIKKDIKHQHPVIQKAVFEEIIKDNNSNKGDNRIIIEEV